MSVKDILQIGHQLLAAPSKAVDVNEIPSPTVQGWITDMIDTMRAANGAGISANQIGIPHPMFVMEITDIPSYPYKPKMP